ncbi:MAG TPA: DnaA regulatory inactivator Hda [Casimicrobiaceae bacterium]|nr:DnaA regulatory inactivator Hda [Casimicrobiaceae bacterium]
MTEQLVFELAHPEPPSFANFLPGSNHEAIEALARIANGTLPETGLVIWGASGAGKSHLLRATVAACAARGRSALHVAEPRQLDDVDPRELASTSLVVVDDVDAAGDSTQARLFTLYNAARAGGRHVLLASRVPPASLHVREDLRTRLGWGLVYEIVPLADADKPAALIAYARQRGFNLAPEVVRYLLVHGRRDMTTLLATLAALDRHSLATKRAVTVAMLRAWLQREIDVD